MTALPALTLPARVLLRSLDLLERVAARFECGLSGHEWNAAVDGRTLTCTCCSKVRLVGGRA